LVVRLWIGGRLHKNSVDAHIQKKNVQG
jgi:hypothetical protein